MEGELTEHPGFLTACAYHIAVLVMGGRSEAPTLKPGNAHATQKPLEI
jgi:hypothetical protein